MTTRESFTGRRQAVGCPDCEAARGSEAVSGWRLGGDGFLHNHMIGASVNPAFQAWKAELEAEVSQRMAFARRTAPTSEGLAAARSLSKQFVGTTVEDQLRNIRAVKGD